MPKPKPVDFLAKMTEEEEEQPASITAAAVKDPPTIKQVRQDTSKGYVPPARQGKKMLGGYYSEEVHDQLEQILFENRKNADVPKKKEHLLDDALDMLFRHYGKPQIAKHEKTRR